MVRPKLFLSFLMAGLFSVSAYSQKVTTYAGAQFSGLADESWYDNVTAGITSAKINFPYGIALDPRGYLYISDFHNNKIRLVVGSSIYNRSGMSGGSDVSFGYQDGAAGGAGGGWLYNPAGICFNPLDSTIIIADMQNHAIRRFSKYISAGNTQTLSTIAGDISEINTINGRGFSGSADGHVTNDARFNRPSDVAVDSYGNIYVADRSNHTIRKISGTTVSTVAGSAGASGHADATGSAARFNLPTGIFLENDNSLIVADFGNSCIRKVNLTTKEVTTIAGVPEVSGGNDGPASTAKFEYPTDVVVNNGIIYVSDSRSNVIRYIAGGMVRSIAGKYLNDGYANDTASAALFSGPRSLVYSTAEKALYVSEEGNNVIRRVQLSPVVNFAADKTAVQVNIDVTITNNSSPGTEYKWTIAPSTYTLKGGSTLDSKDLQVAFTAAGAYNIKLVVTNELGKDSLTKTAYILVSNSSGIADNKDLKQLMAFPNPTAGSFTLVSETEFKQARVNIVNVLGQSVYEGTVNGKQAELSLAGQRTGLYFVKVENNGITYSAKIQLVN